MFEEMANASVLSEKKLPLWNDILIGHDVVNRYFPPILPSKSELIDLLFFFSLKRHPKKNRRFEEFCIVGRICQIKVNIYIRLICIMTLCQTTTTTSSIIKIHCKALLLLYFIQNGSANTLLLFCFQSYFFYRWTSI